MKKCYACGIKFTEKGVKNKFQNSIPSDFNLIFNKSERGPVNLLFFFF